MYRSKSICIAAACLVASAGLAVAAEKAVGVSALEGLSAEYPGVRFHRDDDRLRIIYGKPMTTAPTPRLATERFLAEHGEAFGAGDLDLVEEFNGEVNFGKFHVFHYQQMLEGLPVELSPGRVLTLNNGDGTWSVVYAAGLFVGLPQGGFAPMNHTAQDALNFVRGSVYGRLPKWSEAELVVYQRRTAEGVEAVRAWKFVGENPDLLNRAKFTFFVDAATGAMLEARDEVLDIDVFGNADGWATPGVLPDLSDNLPTLQPMNSLQIRISGGNSEYTEADGSFDISHGGNTDVTLNSDLDTGEWVNINNQGGGGVLSESITATPGVEAQITYNSTPSEFETAQVNAFIHTGKIHDYIRDRSSWTGMDFRCTANVNLNSSCNAFFDGSSINFYREAGGCVNTAYSTVVAHEYGHYIVSRLGLAQGAFGEGYGDTCGELLYDTGIVGEHFFLNGGNIRDNDNTIRTYPCSGGVHFCGQLLGGVWWHIREPLGDTYGSSQGLAVAQQLHVDWTVITTGGQGDNSAHPGTAIEVLTVDDDDGNLDNGTPNYADICEGFNLHNIDCPEVNPIIFSYPGGLPEIITPNQDSDIAVDIAGNGVDPVPSSAEMWYFVDGGGLSTTSLDHNGGTSYTATIPGQDCTSIVDYFFRVDGDDGNTYEDPDNGDLYSVGAYDEIVVIVDDNFETDTGWTVQDTDLQTGSWDRAVPANGGSRGDPANDYDGSGRCWVTGNATDEDIDGGPTRLISPAYDLSGDPDAIVSYARWFTNDDQDIDRLDVHVSNGGGWVLVESVPGSNGWTEASFRVSDYVTPNSTVQVRFSATDNPNDSVSEGAVDAFRILSFVCSDECVADFNGDGEVNTLDVLAFLNAYTAGDSSADINGDGEVNTLDVLAFLNLWNAGC